MVPSNKDPMIFKKVTLPAIRVQVLCEVASLGYGELPAWIVAAHRVHQIMIASDCVFLQLHPGILKLEPDEWIIMCGEGELMNCDDALFQVLYEAAE